LSAIAIASHNLKNKRRTNLMVLWLT